MATVTIRPNGDGTYDGDWALTGGTAGQAYTTIDESSTDDADYISNNDTTSPYQRQSVTLGDMPAASAISSVILKFRARSAFGGSAARVVPFIRSGGSDQDSSEITTTSADAEYSWDITSLVSWTDTLINALEVGWRRNSTGSNTLRVSQAWVEITYTEAGQSITPTGIASGLAFGSPTVTPGAVSILPTGIASGLAFGSHVISQAGAQSITPTGIATDEAFGSPTVTPGVATIIPALVLDSFALGILGTANLMAYWRFAEPSGTLAEDSSGNDVDGTYVNSPTLGVPSLLEHYENDDLSVAFDGTNDHVVMTGSDGDFNFAADAEFTVLFLIKITEGLSSGVLVDQRELSPDTDGWVIVKAGEDIALELWSGSGLDARAAVTGLANDTTYFLAFTASDVALTAYQDGSAVDGDTRTSVPAVSEPLTVGRAAASAIDFFEGGLDELAIFSRELDAGEIFTLNEAFTTRTLDESGIPSEEAFGTLQIDLHIRPVIDAYAVAVLSTVNLAAYWRLAELSGTTAVDSSGNGFDGTYTGGPSLGQDTLLVNYPNEDKSIALLVADDDRVVVGGNFFNFNGTLPFTVMFLVNLFDVGTIATIIDRTDRDPDWNGWAVRQNNDEIVLEIYDNNSLTASATLSGLSAGVIYHVAFTLSATEITSYLDGAVAGSPDTRSSIPASVADLTIGAQTDNTDHFGGYIDEVALFARALDGSEVVAIYESSLFLDNAYGGIASLEAFGLPDVAPGAASILPTGIATDESFGTPLITLYVTPTGIASGLAFGSPTVSPGAVSITPTGIESDESFGTPTLVMHIYPLGIETEEAFGDPVVDSGGDGQSISPTGIPTGASFGSHTLTTGGVLIVPTGIASGQAFGSPIVSPGVVLIAPTGIPTSESFGTPVLGLYVTPTGIVSGQAFGQPTITVGGVTILPSSIASAESFGIPHIDGGLIIIITTPTRVRLIDGGGRGVEIVDAGTRGVLLVDDGRRFIRIVR
jgi:hypothetical protein